MNHLEVGPLHVTLHRTVRVGLDQVSSLPPSLGSFKVYKVADYRETCPPQWEDNAVFVPIHMEEALWMSFERKPEPGRYRYQAPIPVAVMVGAGGINALNGEKLGTKLEKDNYMVAPPQPWLDGWKDKDGTVYQFVGTEYQKGEGKTIGEQIMGAECKTGGIGIAVFEAKEPEKLVPEQTPREYYKTVGGPCGQSVKSFGHLESLNYSSADDCDYEQTSGPIQLCSLAAFGESGGSSRKMRKVAEMGVGKGGKINQKIYPDPHGLEVWKEQPTAAVAVYLVNAEQFSEITGLPMPPLPKSVEDYHGQWYGLKDVDKKDVAGTDAFTGLKAAFAGDTSNVVTAIKDK